MLDHLDHPDADPQAARGLFHSHSGVALFLRTTWRSPARGDPPLVHHHLAWETLFFDDEIALVKMSCLSPALPHVHEAVVRSCWYVAGVLDEHSLLFP